MAGLILEEMLLYLGFSWPLVRREYLSNETVVNQQLVTAVNHILYCMRKTILQAL